MKARAKVVELPGVRTAGQERGTEPKAPVRSLRPAQCRAYMRRTLAREFPGIVDGFVKSAKRGSCQHVKLATELLETKGRPQGEPSGRTTLQGILRKMEQLED